MTRKTASTSLAILAALALAPLAAQAQSGSPAGYVAPGVGNVVGGGSASLLGGGDDMTILYSPGGAGGGARLAQTGRSARFAGTNGDGSQVEYLDAAPAGAGHGREAWLLGGGDGAEVVYAPPTRR